MVFQKEKKEMRTFPIDFCTFLFDAFILFPLIDFATACAGLSGSFSIWNKNKAKGLPLANRIVYALLGGV